MTAPGPARHIPLPGVFNLRDIGGYPAGAGAVLRWRSLLRSDGLHRLDDAGREVLAGIGLRTIIDLRTPAEAWAAPSALGGLAVTETRIPLIAGDLDRLPPVLSGVYQHMVDHCGAAIVAVIRRLCAPGAFPALVHCTAGKDRTGVLVALLLSALDVPDDVIAADYALSRGYLYGLTDGGRRLTDGTGLPERFAPELLAAPPELILGVLARARSQGGGVPGYLAGHGLSRADLEMLRTALVDARPLPYPTRRLPGNGRIG